MDKPTTILVIDDEPDNFDVIDTLLMKEEYQLNYASSGSKALERIHLIEPDLILLDVMMPEMDGIELCKIIKTDPQWRYIPIIMVTALTAKEDLSTCLAAGADDFVSKPVNKIELQARIRSMLRLKYQHDQLKALIQLREDMVNMIVHDLRNPLTNIMLCTDILQLPNFPPAEHQPKLEQIQGNVKQLQSMIDSLLFMAKLESGKMKLNLTEVDLHHLCSGVLADFRLLAEQHRIQLVGELPQPGQKFTMDGALFRRVLDNLLANAIKFSPVNTQVSLKVDFPTTDEIKIQVIDSGIGVDEKMRTAIFEKYEIGALIKGLPQTGLGLAFCKQVVDAHGGSLQVEENFPKGAIFIIQLRKNLVSSSTSSVCL
jgi:two-component system sensor histidine kinase/response regulator